MHYANKFFSALARLPIEMRSYLQGLKVERRPRDEEHALFLQIDGEKMCYHQLVER